MKTLNANIYLMLAGLNSIVRFSSFSIMVLSICYANDSYPYGEEVFTTRNTGGRKMFIGYEDLMYKASTSTSNNSSTDSSYLTTLGGAIFNDKSSSDFKISKNLNVSFTENSAYTKASSVNYHPYGRATSSATASGGAIYNKSAIFTLSGNISLSFIGNVAKSNAITNTSNYNDKSCDAYSYSYGGAIYNDGINSDFIISDNKSVLFCGNLALASSTSQSGCSLHEMSQGGAIYNNGMLSIVGNEDVVFERNAEVKTKNYRLRSIYSTGTLNLSASEGARILFKDSIYAHGTVNLNQGGSGDIVLSGASTEDDLLVVKGATGTAEEISNSRTSDIGEAMLYGGRLMVEDKAVCQFSGIAVADDARIIVKDASLQHSSGNMVVTQARNVEKAELKGISLESNALYGQDVERIGVIQGSALSISNTATLSVKYVTLDAMTQFNSAGTSLAMTEVTSQMTKGVNSTLVGEDFVLSDTMLVRSGNGAETLTMAAGATVLQLENSAFDAKALQGDTLHLILSGYTMEEIQARDYLVISFKNSAAYASLDKDLTVSLQVAGVEGAVTITGWYLASDIQNGGTATALYFETAKIPEPATATLSLLALAALATRRRRK